MNRASIFAAMVCLLVLTTNAGAQCRDPQNRTKVIYSESFGVNTNQGRGTAQVVYTVASSSQACESGSAAGITDGRKCQFVNISRTFNRTMKMTPPSGAPIDLGVKTISERTHPPRNFSDNCNNHAAGGAEWEWADFIDKALGDESNWRAEIDHDDAEVRRALSLFGTLTQ